ncbi:MAG: hypothetical protein WKF84_24940 [Pyrinomonadaceae bacterium]
MTYVRRNPPGRTELRAECGTELLTKSTNYVRGRLLVVSCPHIIRALLRGFHRIACALPRFEAAEERGGVRDAFVFEVLHRTGAGMLARSRTVSNNHFVAWQLAGSTGNFTFRDRERALDVADRVSVLTPYINYKGLVLGQSAL